MDSEVITKLGQAGARVGQELECVNRRDLVPCGELAKAGRYWEDRTVQPPL